MSKAKKHHTDKDKTTSEEIRKTNDNLHVGSSNAFEETENPLSKDLDDISDERLDDLLDE